LPGKKQALIVLLLVPLFLFMIAQEGESSSGKSEFLGKVINFVVLFGGLGYLLYKPLRSYLRKKSEGIEKAIAEAREARLDAERKLQEAKKRLAALEAEVFKIIKDGEKEGRQDKERIKAVAEKEAERIKMFGQQEIEAQLRAGKQELKEYTAELATSLAEARLKGKMTSQDHVKLIDKSIEKLAELYEKPSSD
jgi:F-type H+-transporting ATPase subunit b